MNKDLRRTMLHDSERDEFEEEHKHDRFLLFLCFLASALIGYFLTHHVALLGV